MSKETALSLLKTLLPRGRVFTDSTSLVAYEADGGIDKGLPQGVVFPYNAEDVDRVVSWAAQYHFPLIGRGAGTGLSGGAVADRGGVVVEFSHMNHILDLDAQGRSALVEPALINLRLDERARRAGLYFPPDPGSQRASTIGGNVAENAGGPHCFKYGVTTNYVTGLEVVLANGRRIRVGGHALDYPEYDLCGLITGSEGMLGLITAITVRLVRNPPAVKTMLAVFDSVEQAGHAVSAVIAAGLVPATMEMMDKQINHMIEPFAHAGLPMDAGATLIIEVDGYPESLDAQMAEIDQILQQHGGHVMRISSNEEERARIWLARKSAGGAVARAATSYYTVDITVPRSRLAEMLLEVDKLCARYDVRAGHLLHAGDGNLHPMLLIPDPEDPDLMRRVLNTAWGIVRKCVEMGGSLTGEHGVGIEKREFMAEMHTPEELMTMWDVKLAFDPKVIFNPGKVFPSPGAGETGPFAGYSAQSRLEPDREQSRPSGTFIPAKAEEAVKGLVALARANQQVYIGKASGSNPNAVTLDTSSLSGIKTYAPDDLYITVGAGTPLSEVQSFLARKGKQIALTSPWPSSTIGGLVATNLNAPQRMRYGSIRDNVLYVTAALTDGRLIRTGRPIVKNVAGYDLTKAFVGSYGTLGLITDVTLKLIGLPRARRSLLVPVDDVRHGLIWARQLLPIALNASALVLSKGYEGIATVQSRYLLTYTAEGLGEDVRCELEQVRQALHAAGAPEPVETDELTGTDIWTAMLGTMSGLQIRVGLPVRELPAYIQDQARHLQDIPFIADISSGFVHAIQPAETEAASWLESLRKAALINEGYAIALSVPEGLRTNPEDVLDRWGYQPQGLEVMKRLKARWDPQGILNPGVFVADL
ncbi:FAD-binding oxidoreductase [Ktedonosporobacter rubrisoli]|uniref:FAD-binding oxidoreductase n=1 Tax=Ktedonosporobacter rubrisoli TaxID=2509675 RepID=A0A4P6JXE9_KTERU|nr:FAD-binding oxidoreductase [Ktedonosporobacter rubrisoli]QBD80205.1 FAD-binding oxidoreductase [Ktedonosporobacter rubrisoli]